MSVDVLQEKIRKLKNPSVVELLASPWELPVHLLQEEESAVRAYSRFCRELMERLKGQVPAVRISFGAFALLGAEGMTALTETLKTAASLGYYVLLDAPEMLSPKAAEMTADAIFGRESLYPCDGLVISGYLGSDIIKPFLRFCEKQDKDIFVVARTANKSAPELQDLLAGSRLVHMAAADHANRCGGSSAGKRGYTRVGILAGASSSESIRILREKYPKLYMLLDGADYPNANAKNCSYAFDQFGHGAAACIGSSVTGAWAQTDSDGRDYLDHAEAAAERMRKNLTRYITIL